MTEFAARMDALRLRFLERCRVDAETLAAEAGPEAQIEIAHRISGSAGLFGFDELGEAAQTYEEALRAGSTAAKQKRELLEQLEGVQAR